MKLQSDNLLENLSKEELKYLSMQVKETVAKEFKSKAKRNFSVAQFWDIQRRKRNFSAKRIIF
jgi:hypothetical protein